jgi:hypothetical protein
MDGRKQYERRGSRYADGNVPNANWNDGEFNVNWNNVDNRNPKLRSRVEVSRIKSAY